MINVATCVLNQWALDFKGNLKRSLESFEQAKKANCVLRLGPELELCGYFMPEDTIIHSFEVLAELLQADVCQDILGDVGMPMGVRYNARVMFYNKKILLIRPKKALANDGNYREMRWFTPWMKDNVLEDFYLPAYLSEITGQTKVPFGDGGTIGTELCEELFTPNSPHIKMSLAGIDIFTNGSASHHEFQKLNRRVDLIREATSKCGGVYQPTLNHTDKPHPFVDKNPILVPTQRLVERLGTIEGMHFLPSVPCAQ